MDWARILAYVTGTVDQDLPVRNEYLATENRILKDLFLSETQTSFGRYVRSTSYALQQSSTGRSPRPRDHYKRFAMRRH
jgi:hypothetical protein